MGVAVLVVVAAVAGAGFLLTSDDKGSEAPDDSAEAEVEVPVLEATYDYCSTQKGARTLTLGDEGRTLVIDTESEYGPMGGLLCVLSDLGTSQAVIAQIENTTSMMGVQEADDGGLHYQFSYHPDNGVNMVITDQVED